MKWRALRRALAATAIIAIVLVFTLETLPHRHAWGLDDRGCPACQAARQHVGDAPGSAGVHLRPPEPQRPPAVEPAIERLAFALSASSAAPRSPPAAA